MKTIFITGVSSGIGLETAKLFADNGWQVYGTVRNSTIKIDNKNIKLFSCDLANPQQRQNLFSQMKELPTIDVLVNNAGFGYLGPVEVFTYDEIKEQFEVNFFAITELVNQLTPKIRANGGGKIINISSVCGLVSLPIYGIYCASKFALEAYSEALAFELKAFNIFVSLVEPGEFKTNFSKNKKYASQSTESVYKNWFTSFLNRNAKFNKNNSPTKVAKLIFKIANTPKPGLRYKIGLDTYIYTILHALLPYQIWVKLIGVIYKWKD